MTDRLPRGREGHSAEERYWRTRTMLEGVRFALSILTQNLWEVLRRH